MSALIASAGILYGPGALLFFRVLIAFLISPFDGLLQSTDKVSSAGTFFVGCHFYSLVLLG